MSNSQEFPKKQADDFNLETSISDLVGAASALALAIDGLEVFSGHSEPNERQFSGLHWLAARLHDGVRQLDDVLLPISPPQDGLRSLATVRNANEQA